MVSVLRPSQRILHIPGISVTTSRRAVSGNGLLNNLVAYWALDEAAGANNALDKHTNGLTLTQAASPGSAAGIVYAGARTFNGTSQYFSRASETLLQTGDVDFTVAAWLYFTGSASDADIVSKYETVGNKREYRLRYSAIANAYGITLIADGIGGPGKEATATWGSVPTLNVWEFLIAWYDSGNNILALSVNNSAAVTVSYSLGSFVSVSPFAIGALGRASPALFFPGRIGPVAMWKSAAGAGGVLTAAQRTALYNSGAGLAYAAFTT